MDGLCERFTLYPSRLKEKLKNTQYRLWIHAASVGEVRLLQMLPGFPEKHVFITCTNVTGRNLARKYFPDNDAVLLPVDLIFLIKRLKSMISPAKVVILETELWPGFIFSVKELKVNLINARLSDKKYAWYLFFKKYFKEIFKWIDSIYVRDEENLDKFRQIGVENNRLIMQGNVKYNYTVPDLGEEAVFKKPDHPVIVCGSTHSDEEEILIDTFKELKHEFSQLSIIISPRHLNRIKEIENILGKKDVPYTKWSERNGALQEGEVVLVDKMGELSRIYSISKIAFIGGSMVPAGGHNIIEAAVWGVPIVTGRYYYNFSNMVEYFVRSGGLRVANDSKDLYTILREIFSSEELREEMGRKNYMTALNKKEEITDKLKNILC